MRFICSDLKQSGVYSRSQTVVEIVLRLSRLYQHLYQSRVYAVTMDVPGAQLQQQQQQQARGNISYFLVGLKIQPSYALLTGMISSCLCCSSS